MCQLLDVKKELFVLYVSQPRALLSFLVQIILKYFSHSQLCMRVKY